MNVNVASLSISFFAIVISFITVYLSWRMRRRTATIRDMTAQRSPQYRGITKYVFGFTTSLGEPFIPNADPWNGYYTEEACRLEAVRFMYDHYATVICMTIYRFNTIDRKLEEVESFG